MRAMRPVTWFLVVVALCASCASAEKDAGSSRPAQELAVGAARLHGGTIRMDVQLGRPLPKRAAKAGTVTMTPNTPVVP